MWLHSLKVAQLLRSAACLHTNQSLSYLNHLVFATRQHCWQHYIIITAVSQSSQFQVFYLNARKFWWKCEIVKFHLIVKFTLQQTTKAQRGSRDTALLFL